MILLVLIFILGVIGGAIYLLNLDQPKIDRVRNWVKNNGSLIIAGTFLLVVGILIYIFNIRWTNLGFLAAVGGILIYFLYSLKKGKETNWWFIASLVIVLGVGYYLFHEPIVTKEGAVEKKAGSLYEKAHEKGYAKALLSEAKERLWKPSPKPAPYVPSYQRIASGEFIGKGFGGKDSILWTGWLIPETARQGDIVKYKIPKGAYIELPNQGSWYKYNDPEVKVNVLSSMGEINLKASRNSEIYVELWGIR